MGLCIFMFYFCVYAIPIAFEISVPVSFLKRYFIVLVLLWLMTIAHSNNLKAICVN